MGKIRVFLPLLVLFVFIFPLYASDYTEQYVYGDTVSFVLEDNQNVKRGTVFSDENSNVLIASDINADVVVLQRLYGSGEYTQGSTLNARRALYTLSAFSTYDFAGLTLSRTGTFYPLIPVVGATYTFKYSEVNVFAGLKVGLSLSSVTKSSFALLKYGYVDVLAGFGTDTSFSGASLLTSFMYRYNYGRYSFSAGACALKSAKHEYRLGFAVGAGVSI